MYMVTKRQDGTIGHKVFRKKTNIERDLHADSYHNPSQNIGVLNTLITRGMIISDEEHSEEEKRHLSKKIKNIQYLYFLKLE